MRRDVFQAIADPIRRDIIALLANEPLTINEVAIKFEISRPAVSKHVKILNECGIVEINKKGRERYCQIQPQNLLPAFLWIEQYKNLWEARLDTFGDYLNELQLKKEQMQDTNDLNSRTVTIEKTYQAPIALVWDAWTNPEHIAEWWGPKGMQTRVLEHNFSVGGKWEYAMAMPDGNDFISEGTYLEIVAMKKIVTSADFKPMTEGVELHILLEAVGTATKFTFKVIHPTEEYKIQQEKMGIYNGWGSTFDRLDTFLAQK